MILGNLLELGNPNSEYALVKKSRDVVVVSIVGQDEGSEEPEPSPFVAPDLDIFGWARSIGCRVGQELWQLGPIPLNDEMLVVFGVNTNVDVMRIKTRGISDDEVAAGRLCDVKSVAPRRDGLEVSVLGGMRGSGHVGGV